MPAASPIQIEIENDVAIVRARPGCAPVLGIAFISIVSLLVFLLLGGLDNLDSISWLSYGRAWAIGAALFFVGLMILRSSRYPIASFRKDIKTVKIAHWKPFRSRRTIPWEQILAVVTTAQTSKNGESEFGLNLLLKNGDKLRLSPRSYPDGAACDDAARILNRFMTGS